METGTIPATATFTVEAKQTAGDKDNPNTGAQGDVPQTGDNSMMALWIAVLFVSGFGVVATAVYGKKRTFDKAPSPSSERNNQAQIRQNNFSLGRFPKSPLTPNGLSAHQIKPNIKDKLKKAKAGISSLHAKPQ